MQMDEGEDFELQNVNLQCNVCGETEFNEREGYYYCVECGTKHEQVRAIEVAQEEMFTEGQYAKTHKIKKKAVEHVELTSWECYNYILRGMVEELLNYGAKEELKQTVLQLWAAYLRRNEVAFFNKNNTVLPKLGVRYCQRDARTIYNHAAKKRKRRVRKRNVLSGDEEKSSKRAWKRSKRKLDESAYSALSLQTTCTSQSGVTYDSVFTDNESMNTANTINSKAVQMSYSMSARKILKKLMPLKHLRKHESDVDGTLKCHNIRLKSREINYFALNFGTLSIKQVYAILGIALNLIGDDIQLSDLVRFIAEEHITVRNVLQYLPENVRDRGQRLLYEIDFFKFPEKYSNRLMREHISLVARGIPILGFELPKMGELTRRYVKDLNLPSEFADYIERLITVLPPKMNTRMPHQYPQYEARAMAYIVFVAKSLFGLDGQKEDLISASAIVLNKKLNVLKTTKSGEVNGQHQPPLFVWSEWYEYVEMRKIFISQYNPAYGRQFKEDTSTDVLVNDIIEKEQRQKEDEYHLREVTKGRLKSIQGNMKRIFNGFLSDSGMKNTTTCIRFQPSLTPSSSYLKRLMLHADTEDGKDLKIPDIFKVDHAQRSLTPFLDATSLGAYLKAFGFQLNVEEVACKENRDYIGVFRSGKSYHQNSQKSAVHILKAYTDVTHEEWKDEIVERDTFRNTGLVLRQDMAKYGKDYQNKLEQKTRERCGHVEEALRHFNLSLQIKDSDTKQISNANNKLNDLSSIDVFVEDNMQPLNDQLEPRRVMKPEVSKGTSFEDETFIGSQSDQSASVDSAEVLTLKRSNFDYWTLSGYTFLILDEYKKEVFDKLPPSFGWLLQMCASMIGVNWFVLYEQLMVLEFMFLHGIENLKDHSTCLRFAVNNPVKDINVLVRSFREIW